MLVVGLTGGIGSGKTTFASMLEARGAEIIDADELGRRALHPGSHAWNKIVEAFGDEVRVAGGMEIDRRRLASIVFNDRDKLATLNAIVHPVIVSGIADTLEMLRDTDEIVVLDAALIFELGLAKTLDLVIVVDTDERLRRKRLASARGMTDLQITERMSAQLDPEVLLEKADIVVRNNGSEPDLEAEADRVWAELEKHRAG